ncbi:YfdX family protein [Methylomarinum vadi]|uniref:YfdX family protein n=1 Tax=Methylomarinum vadi TaxID=438855 RepID=UPI000565B542|nr:YfdX family protein [Methylomarinum vadi]
MYPAKLKTITAAVALALTASTFIGQSVSAAAANPPATTNSKQEKGTQSTKEQLLREKQQKIEQEAKAAIQGTREALQALRQNDSVKATALLQKVSGELDILLAKHPDLKMIPADVQAQVFDLDSSPEQVEKMVDSADELLDDEKVQDARYILSALVSEIRITTTSIPLGVFPEAIKEAASLSEQGKTDQAAEALSDVLNMLVSTTDVIPLPVLRAEALLTAASELEHKSDLSKQESRADILRLTDAAKQKLKLAEVLGYGDKKDYKPLYQSIDEIKDVIHSEKSAATWNKIKKSLSDFKNKIIHPTK